MPTNEEVDFVNGRTRIFGIVGDPIAQVRSPEMVSAEFRRRGLEALMIPLHVRAEDFDALMPSLMRLANLRGFIFTIPFKVRAVALAARLDANAMVVGSINALRRVGDAWEGEVFDGLGCVEGFRRRGFVVTGNRLGLIGAGGAGSAIAIAMAREKPAFIRLFDVDRGRVDDLATKVRRVSPETVVEVAPPRADDVDILLNASPVGMLDDARLPLAVERLPAELIVFDAIVKPERTPLLALAEACGCRTVYGREMMRGQISKLADYFEPAIP